MALYCYVEGPRGRGGTTADSAQPSRPRHCRLAGGSDMLFCMTESITHSRSPELMRGPETTLLIVDVQERLVRAIADHGVLLGNLARLIAGARLLDVSIVATEQYPRGLGPTVSPLRESLVGAIYEKLTFSCGGCSELMEHLARLGTSNVLVAGIEAHVCVQQTVLDLLHAGYRVYVAADGVGSRQPVDLQWALRRMETSGAILTSVESALFEWCESAQSPKFKELSRLVKPPIEPVVLEPSP